MLIIPIKENNRGLLEAVNGSVSGFEFDVFSKHEKTFLIMEEGKKNRIISYAEFNELKCEKEFVTHVTSVIYYAP